MDDRFRPSHFRRRQMVVRGADLDAARKIEVTVQVDGKTFIRAQLREPGLLAIVSAPDEQGIVVEWVEVAGPQYTDYRMPGGDALMLAQWQLEALGIDG